MRLKAFVILIEPNVGGSKVEPNVLAMQEMRHSADVLAAGLLEMADPELSTRYFRQRQPQVTEQSFSITNTTVSLL